MENAATIITSLADGATAVASGVGTTITNLVSNAQVLTLIGLAIGYGIVKFVIHFLPMIRSGR